MPLMRAVWVPAALLMAVGCDGGADVQDAGRDSGMRDAGEVQCTGQYEMPSACGGDTAGRWRVASACTGPAFQRLVSGCDGASALLVSASPSGYLEFSSSGFVRNQVRGVKYSLQVPLQCVAGGCSSLGLSCVSQGSGCNCVVDTSTATTNDEGSYTTDRGLLSLVPSSTGLKESYFYCVKEDQLWIRGDGTPSGGDPIAFEYARE